MGKRVQKVSLNNLSSKTLDLGYMGEHEHTRIEIDCTEVLWDYPNATASMVVQPPTGDMYPLTPTREEDTIVWLVTDSDVANHGTGSVQITFTNNGEIVKSAIGTTRVRQSIVATGEAPDPIQTWIDQAEETAAEIAAEAAAGVVDDLAEAKDAAIEAIEAKGEETIESIPEDYTNLSNQVTDLKSAKAPCVYESVSGAIASFVDGADGMPLKSLSVDIDPVQDLHGYDNPWPAGGGKNLLKNNLTSKTQNGITVSVDDFGVITITGTASANTSFTINSSVGIGPGSYVVNGITSPSALSYKLEAQIDGAWGNNFISGDNAVTASTGITSFVLYIYSGTAFTTAAVVKPMIRLASVTDATFAPYSNICTITGHSSVTVTRTGKNLLNANSSYTFTSQSDLCTCALIAGTYTFSVDTVNNNTSITSYVRVINGNTTLGSLNVTSGTKTRQNISFTLTEDSTVIIRGAGASSGYSCTVSDLQIELGSTASPYVSYQGISIQIPLGQTVYGGTLDAVAGTLTITDAQIASYAGETLPGVWISDRDVYAEGTTPTTGAQVVYKLATPTVITGLDETTITTLLGQNNIFADSGAVSVQYPADTKAYVDSKGGVMDVQVNGTSVVTDGVAAIPIAGSSFGVVKINNTYGVGINNNNELYMQKASNDQVKAGSIDTRPVVPEKQHMAVFYGLATAAGDTTQKSSSNAVGTYTADAIGKILAMLGVSDLIGNPEGATASKAYSANDVLLYKGKLYKVTASIAQGAAIVPGTNCTQTNIINMIGGN